MAFEEFTQRRRVITDQSTISISKHGFFGLNERCCQEFLKGYKFVVLYYDRDRNVIGIKPTKTASEKAYTIRYGRNGKVANITAIAFLKYFGIKHGDTKRYITSWNATEKLIEIDLNQ